MLAAAEPAAVQVGGKDLGVVDDEGVAPAQQRRQIAHDAVLELGRRAGPHHQKPGGIARRRRPQRDAVLRQREIEQVGAHSRSNFHHGVKLHYNAHIATFRAAINVTANAVIQVKPGIGDVIWHLPFIRAIAAAAPGGRVTFLAPPSSGAKELLAAEPGVAETVYFEHAGSELQRGLNLIRLAALLRRQPFPLDLDSRPHHPPGACRHARRHTRAHRAWPRPATASSSPIPASIKAISTTSRSIGCAR